MNLFTYGVLQHNRILQPLCGQEFSMRPARLRGYRKIFFDYEPFAPCAIVVPDSASSVQGQLLTDVAARHLPTFDRFECVDQGLYTRISHPVIDGDEEVQAWVYVAGEKATPYLGADWDEASFLHSGRLDYLEKLLSVDFDPQTQQLTD
ncbi:MAG: gamma-glutamylcyclotransferase family protein [Pseudomonadota bacterium]